MNGSERGGRSEPGAALVCAGRLVAALRPACAKAGPQVRRVRSSLLERASLLEQSASAAPAPTSLAQPRCGLPWALHGAEPERLRPAHAAEQHTGITSSAHHGRARAVAAALGGGGAAALRTPQCMQLKLTRPLAHPAHPEFNTSSRRRRSSRCVPPQCQRARPEFARTSAARADRRASTS